MSQLPSLINIIRNKNLNTTPNSSLYMQIKDVYHNIRIFLKKLFPILNFPYLKYYLIESVNNHAIDGVSTFLKTMITYNTNKVILMECNLQTFNLGRWYNMLDSAYIVGCKFNTTQYYKEAESRKDKDIKKSYRIELFYVYINYLYAKDNIPSLLIHKSKNCQCVINKKDQKRYNRYKFIERKSDNGLQIY